MFIFNHNYISKGWTKDRFIYNSSPKRPLIKHSNLNSLSWPIWNDFIINNLNRKKISFDKIESMWLKIRITSKSRWCGSPSMAEGEEIRATVTSCPITELVTVTQRVQNWHGTFVYTARTASTLSRCTIRACYIRAPYISLKSVQTLQFPSITYWNYIQENYHNT